MTELASASFPVVFFDGDREIDVGTVPVHPLLGFKMFQALVGQKIGMAPHQISTSLVRRRKARSSPEIRRRVPIDESSDFAAIARERDCFVLALVKRSRRERRGGRHRRGGHPAAAGGGEPDGTAGGAPEKTILRRNPLVNLALAGVVMPELAFGIGLWGCEMERYLLSCYGAMGMRMSTAAPTCEECRAAEEEGSAAPFHWCVYDEVTEGFRSRVGPIQRPPKKHVEDSA